MSKGANMVSEKSRNTDKHLGGILNNLVDSFLGHPLRIIADMLLVLLGLLIIAGGRIAIQPTPESEIRWIEVSADMDKWLGWALIWLAADDILFKGKATIFLLSKTVIPVVETILKAILGEDQFSRLIKRFQKEPDEIKEVEGEPHQNQAT